MSIGGKKIQDNDFIQGNASAYASALRNGWLNEYDWFVEQTKRKFYWNEERCKKEAKRFLTRSEFEKANGSAYVAAVRNGWIHSYTWFQDGKLLRWAKDKKWTYKTCEKEAQKYNSRNEFRHGNSSAYKVAKENGWVDEYVWFKSTEEIVTKWTKSACLEIAKQCKSKKEMENMQYSAYRAAKKNGWTKEYTWFLNFHELMSKWNKESCYQEALKYKSRKDFGKTQAYKVAKKNGWLGEYVWLAPKVKRNFWTKEVCETEARKYKTKKEFETNCRGAYCASLRNKWMKDFFWFCNPKRES